MTEIAKIYSKKFDVPTSYTTSQAGVDIHNVKRNITRIRYNVVEYIKKRFK